MFLLHLLPPKHTVIAFAVTSKTKNVCVRESFSNLMERTKYIECICHVLHHSNVIRDSFGFPIACNFSHFVSHLYVGKVEGEIKRVIKESVSHLK